MPNSPETVITQCHLWEGQSQSAQAPIPIFSLESHEEVFWEGGREKKPKVLKFRITQSDILSVKEPKCVNGWSGVPENSKACMETCTKYAGLGLACLPQPLQVFLFFLIHLKLPPTLFFSSFFTHGTGIYRGPWLTSSSSLQGSLQWPTYVTFVVGTAVRSLSIMLLAVWTFIYSLNTAVSTCEVSFRRRLWWELQR